MSNSQPLSTLDTDQYAHILQHPMLDLRAPVEFQLGAFPGAVNIPLMTNDERAQVGTCYKQHGQEAAIRLGHQLVSGSIKEERINQWMAFCKSNPDGFLYCFRGGLRSRIVQQWLAESGMPYPRVTGGYKALRNFCLQQLETLINQKMFVLSGYTGSGKTPVIAALPNSIDLEKAAHHRGSSFGRHAQPQATQINFENHIARQYLNKGHRDTWIFEDESKTIGSCHLPIALYENLKQAPIVLLEASFEYRLQHIKEEYIDSMLAEFMQQDPEQAWPAFGQYLEQSLYAIRKRLGGALYQELSQIQQQAINKHREQGDTQAHLAWLSPLIGQYYDPMYRYQLEQKQERIIFKGDSQAVLEYLSAC